MITMMIKKVDDKGDDKKLKDQSKNNSSESRTIQEFKIRIKKNSRLKIQESREGLIKISMKSFSQKLSSTGFLSKHLYQRVFTLW